MSLIPTCCGLSGPSLFFLLICVYCGIAVETTRKLLYTGIISLMSRTNIADPIHIRAVSLGSVKRLLQFFISLLKMLFLLKTVFKPESSTYTF